jgi:adenosylhomocysteinase
MGQAELLEKGRRSYLWAKRNMPALSLAEEYVKRNSRDLDGLSLAASLHVSKETAVLLLSLRSLGLRISLAAANPLSSQPEIVTYLTSEGISVRARRGESVCEYKKSIKSLVNSQPDLIVDDGGELHVAYAKEDVDSCVGGTDETTSGTLRLLALEKAARLRYPVITVNEAKTKYLFDNRYGTGQSSLDGLLRATDLLVAGKTVVVAGYGWVGKGVAMRAKGLGGRVLITEVDPLRALEAHLDGFEVLPMKEAALLGDIFLTCTGQTDVISREHFMKMKDGAILGNCGHFDREINLVALKALASLSEPIREHIERFQIRGKSIFLLCKGRVVNLVAANGHPPEIMQFSFANQLLCLHYLVAHKEEIAHSTKKVLEVPRQIDQLVSQFALSAFQLKIDKLNVKQRKYSSTFIR